MSPKVTRTTLPLKVSNRSNSERPSLRTSAASASKDKDGFNAATNAQGLQRPNQGHEALAARSRKFEFFPTQSTGLEELIAKHKLPVRINGAGTPEINLDGVGDPSAWNTQQELAAAQGAATILGLDVIIQKRNGNATFASPNKPTLSLKGDKSFRLHDLVGIAATDAALYGVDVEIVGALPGSLSPNVGVSITPELGVKLTGRATPANAKLVGDALHVPVAYTWLRNDEASHYTPRSPEQTASIKATIQQHTLPVELDNESNLVLKVTEGTSAAQTLATAKNAAQHLEELVIVTRDASGTLVFDPAKRGLSYQPLGLAHGEAVSHAAAHAKRFKQPVGIEHPYFQNRLTASLDNTVFVDQNERVFVGSRRAHEKELKAIAADLRREVEHRIPNVNRVYTQSGEAHPEMVARERGFSARTLENGDLVVRETDPQTSVEGLRKAMGPIVEALARPGAGGKLFVDLGDRGFFRMTKLGLTQVPHHPTAVEQWRKTIEGGGTPQAMAPGRSRPLNVAELIKNQSWALLDDLVPATPADRNLRVGSQVELLGKYADDGFYGEVVSFDDLHATVRRSNERDVLVPHDFLKQKIDILESLPGDSIVDVGRLGIRQATQFQRPFRLNHNQLTSSDGTMTTTVLADGTLEIVGMAREAARRVGLRLGTNVSLKHGETRSTFIFQENVRDRASNAYVQARELGLLTAPPPSEMVSDPLAVTGLILDARASSLENAVPSRPAEALLLSRIERGLPITESFLKTTIDPVLGGRIGVELDEDGNLVVPMNLAFPKQLVEAVRISKLINSQVGIGLGPDSLHTLAATPHRGLYLESKNGLVYPKPERVAELATQHRQPIEFPTGSGPVVAQPDGEFVMYGSSADAAGFAETTGKKVRLLPPREKTVTLNVSPGEHIDNVAKRMLAELKNSDEVRVSWGDQTLVAGLFDDAKSIKAQRSNQDIDKAPTLRAKETRSAKPAPTAASPGINDVKETLRSILTLDGSPFRNVENAENGVRFEVDYNTGGKVQYEATVGENHLISVKRVSGEQAPTGAPAYLARSLTSAVELGGAIDSRNGWKIVALGGAGPGYDSGKVDFEAGGVRYSALLDSSRPGLIDVEASSRAPGQSADVVAKRLRRSAVQTSPRYAQEVRSAILARWGRGDGVEPRLESLGYERSSEAIPVDEIVFKHENGSELRFPSENHPWQSHELEALDRALRDAKSFWGPGTVSPEQARKFSDLIAKRRLGVELDDGGRPTITQALAGEDAQVQLKEAQSAARVLGTSVRLSGSPDGSLMVGPQHVSFIPKSDDARVAVLNAEDAADPFEVEVDVPHFFFDNLAPGMRVTVSSATGRVKLSGEVQDELAKTLAKKLDRTVTYHRDRKTYIINPDGTPHIDIVAQQNDWPVFENRSGDIELKPEVPPIDQAQKAKNFSIMLDRAVTFDRQPDGSYLSVRAVENRDTPIDLMSFELHLDDRIKLGLKLSSEHGEPIRVFQFQIYGHDNAQLFAQPDGTLRAVGYNVDDALALANHHDTRVEMIIGELSLWVPSPPEVAGK